MPEIIRNKKTFSLAELTASLTRMFDQHWSKHFWVRAEINKLNHYERSGHAYAELVQKEEGRIVVDIKGIIWKNNWESVRQRFRNELQEELRDGIKILCYAKLNYHPVYGLSLNIQDIDPAFTRGDLEREREETIARLKKLGIFSRNKSLKLALLPQRLAIISVDSSKGYSDFIHVLNQATKHFGYAFFHQLFPALLQGEKAVIEICHQLERISKVAHHFDAILIIRGGGGDIGLSCYNHIDLCSAIANSPLPVFTGIGHSTNLTVAEMIAFNNAITPTDLADGLIQRFHNFSVPLEEARKKILQLTPQILKQAKESFFHSVKALRWSGREELHSRGDVLDKLSHRISRTTQSRLNREHILISQISAGILPYSRNKLMHHHILLAQVVNSLPRICQQLFRDKQEVILQQNKLISAYDPKRVLERGFSITTFKGKALRTSKGLQKGNVLLTHLHVGQIETEVQKILNSK